MADQEHPEDLSASVTPPYDVPRIDIGTHLLVTFFDQVIFAIRAVELASVA